MHSKSTNAVPGTTTAWYQVPLFENAERAACTARSLYMQFMHSLLVF